MSRRALVVLAVLGAAVALGTAAVDGRSAPAQTETPIRPFHAGTVGTELIIPAGKTAAIEDVFAPADGRVVIEQLSARLRLPVGQRAIVLAVDVSAGGQVRRHHFPFVFAGELVGANTYVLAQRTALFADPGSRIRVVPFRGATASTASLRWAVSGRVVDP